MSFLTRIQQTIQSAVTNTTHLVQEAAYSTQEAIDSFSNAIATPQGESYFNSNEYRYFANPNWVTDASTGQRIVGGALATTVIAGAAAGAYLLAEGAAAVAGAVKAGSVALGLGARLALGAATALGLSNCGPSEGENNDINLDLPDASAPVTQNEFCSGTQRLVEGHNVPQANMDGGVQSLAQYPSIRDYLNAHLPEGLTLDNSMVATNPADPQYVYVLAHTPDGAPLAEVGTSTMIFRFQRTMSGYAPMAYPRSLPLNGMNNVLYSSYIGPVSMAYLNPEDFRQVRVGNRSVNISNVLTSNPVIAVVFHDPQDSQEPTRISFIDYQNGTYVQAPGTRNSANVCATYGEILNSQAQGQGDAGRTDARTDVMDASANANQDASTTDHPDANHDASTDHVDAGTDVHGDAGVDVHDANADIPRG